VPRPFLNVFRGRAFSIFFPQDATRYFDGRSSGMTDKTSPPTGADFLDRYVSKMISKR
jgi:hypothetical protein